MYKFKIDKLVLNSIDGEKEIKPKMINVLIGPNNSGKSRLLKELRDYLSGENGNMKIINEINYEYPADFNDLDETYNLRNKVVKDQYGNWFLRAYANKPAQSWDTNVSYETLFTRNFNSIGGDWEEFLDSVIKNKDYASFFQHCGALFYQYVGTEERLTICKVQKNYGLDSNSENYLSAYKFEKHLLNELSDNVKRLFVKDIYLDTQTLGDRLAFRVGNDFSYIKENIEYGKDIVSRLFNEDKLDDQGDGTKSYVSTFLSLKLRNVDVLLLDEPEAFLHPPLARQLGEMIGDIQDDNKQIFISTHSVEVLKGILSVNQDINVIRIAQPVTNENEINVINKEVLKSILESPLLRVSRVMEGLFCEKIIITESEADELIYQELIEKIFPQSGIYFAHGQNKQTLADIAK
ncbi:MAG TPA: AAA family ATPase, partial [Candidatus Pelethocola excrementipullorum]|nr:AAA family ATPase [Candidatus Pelethocola excrementipullorum]